MNLYLTSLSLYKLIITHLLLIGGGHAHVGVLRHFAMNPLPGLRITLLTRDIHTPYSGMLPGLVAGHYTYDECHIDLMPLARAAGARLYHASATGLDLDRHSVMAQGRPDIPYDLLSINTGSTPSMQSIPGAQEYAVPVKPIDHFLQHWQALQKRIACHQGDFILNLVGAGAGGVELALAIQERLQNTRVKIQLFTRNQLVLAGHAPGVQQRLLRVLRQREVTLHTQTDIVRVTKDYLYDAQGGQYPGDAVLWVTHASAPGWLQDTGLALDQQGFI